MLTVCSRRLAARLSFFTLTLIFAIQPTAGYAITTDGNFADWKATDRLDIVPPYVGVGGNEVYNTYDALFNVYHFALKSPTFTPGSTATIYINSDLNAATGYKVFGNAGGCEYVIQVTGIGSAATRAMLYRYTNFATGANSLFASLIVASTPGVVEFQLPRLYLNGSPTSINTLFAFNNSVYLPSNFSAYQYTANAVVRPTRTDISRRIGIVHSASTAARYFDSKAYAQLFMAAQHQAMMAGVPFDLVAEDELLDLANIVNYDALVFPLFSHVKKANAARVAANIIDASFRYKIGLIASGDFLTNDETGAVVSPTPYATESLVFGISPVSSGAANSVKLVPADLTHPVMKRYASGDVLRWYQKSLYTQPIFHVYEANAGVNAKTLVYQQVNGEGTPRSALLATVTGGRNIHFGTDNFFGDTDLLWSAIRWVVAPANATTNAWLQMGRNSSLFHSRIDVDEAKIYETFNQVLVPLATLADTFKARHNVVHTFYVDIGNNRRAGEYTDWVRSGNLYRALMSKGHEIGNHSYTHAEGLGPRNETYPITSDTNRLTDAQLQFEFGTSNSVLQANLGALVTGAAVPGMPDTLATALKIEQYGRFAHLTGGFSGIDYSLGLSLGAAFERNEGAGFHGAFGYLNPTSSMVYLSPNMTPDFTMLDFRKQSAATAATIWRHQIDDLSKFASQPILQMAWHDYGPTTSLASNPPYTVAMYDTTFAYAASKGTEFVTGADIAARIPALMRASLKPSAANPLDVTVSGSGLGTFSFLVDQPKGSTQVIQNVGNWYAYSDTRVFVPDAGGRFVIGLGASSADVTRIIDMPARSRLTSLSGNGTNLTVTFKGQGKMTVIVKSAYANAMRVTGADGVNNVGSRYTLTFNTNKTYVVSIAPGTPVATATPTRISTLPSTVSTAAATPTSTPTATATQTPASDLYCLLKTKAQKRRACRRENRCCE